MKELIKAERELDENLTTDKTIASKKHVQEVEEVMRLFETLLEGHSEYRNIKIYSDIQNPAQLAQL